MKTTLKLIRDEWRVSRPMLDVLRRTDGPLEGPKALALCIILVAIAVAVMALSPVSNDLNEAAKGAVKVFTHP